MIVNKDVNVIHFELKVKESNYPQNAGFTTSIDIRMYICMYISECVETSSQSNLSKGKVMPCRVLPCHVMLCCLGRICCAVST